MCWIKEHGEALIKIGTAFILAEGAQSDIARAFIQKKEAQSALEYSLMQLKASSASIEEVSENFGKTCAALYKYTRAEQERWVNPFDNPEADK